EVHLVARGEEDRSASVGCFVGGRKADAAARARDDDDLIPNFLELWLHVLMEMPGSCPSSAVTRRASPRQRFVASIEILMSGCPAYTKGSDGRLWQRDSHYHSQ